MNARLLPSLRAALPVLIALLALVAGRGTAAAAGPAKATAATGRPMPLDSLASEELRRGRTIAADLGALAQLRRELEYAANQFRRYTGVYPPVIGVAALGTLPAPERVSDAALHAAGYDLVLRDWPDRPGQPRPTLDSTATAWIEPGSERMTRFYFPIVERELGRGTPAEGRERFTPDWFVSAMAGLGTLPGEQNVRINWMNARMNERIPLDRFFAMTRPDAAPAAAKRRGGPAASAPTRRLFDAQAVSFGKFLAHREGERFLGHFYERLLAGDPHSAAFNIARHLLPDPAALEKEWLAWVAEGPGRKIHTPGARGDETE